MLEKAALQVFRGVLNRGTSDIINFVPQLEVGHFDPNLQVEPGSSRGGVSKGWVDGGHIGKARVVPPGKVIRNLQDSLKDIEEGNYRIVE